jgi:hypothetical protein
VVLNNLPKELEQVELDALICGLISAYIGFEEVPGLFGVPALQNAEHSAGKRENKALIACIMS